VTVLKASRAPVALALGKPTFTSSENQWTRPSDWLALTPPGSTEQKFVGLIAVLNQGSNYVALTATVSTGTYTVDWGDGSSPVTPVSGVATEYNYAYSSLSASTDTTRGYRQAIVTVTPTTPGATFSVFSLASRHSARSSTSTTVTWLDVALSAPNATTIRIGGYNAGDIVGLNWLEQATIVSHNCTNLNYLFYGCRALEFVPLFNTAAVTDMSSMFAGCTSLQTVPLFNTAAVTDMPNMFDACGSLRAVPLFNTAAVTNMSIMFSSCTSLISVPLFNMVSVTTTTSMFNGCTSLQTVPLFNTAAVGDFSSMFSGCSSLRAIPLLDTAANAGNMTNFLRRTVSLQTVPLIDTSSVGIVSGMFSTCPSLLEIPELNLSKINSASNNNMSLTGSFTLGRAKLTGMRWTQSFSGCNMAAAQLDEMYTALATLNPNVTNVTNSGGTVTYTVDDIRAFDSSRTVTITGVDPIAYNLVGVTVGTVTAGVGNAGTFNVINAAVGTYVSGGVASLTDNRTITVTGNPGTTGDDPTIATNKGWTVTGS